MAITSPLIVYEITHRCVNDCVYCYNVWKEHADYPKGELALPEVERLFERLFEQVTPSWVILTGGEPMLYPQIVEVVSFLHKKNMRVGIATTGVTLDDEALRQLMDAGVSHFEISLISLVPQTYARLSFNDQLANVRRAAGMIKKNGVKMTLSTVMTRINMREINDVIDFAFAFSADAVALNRFVPGGRGQEHAHELQVSNQELKDILTIANEKSGQYHLPITVTVPVEPCLINHEQFPHLNFGRCTCGDHKWVIDPVGNLRICEQHPDILGNLLKENFLTLTRSDLVRSFRRQGFKGEDCQVCRDFHRCGGGCRFLK